MTAARSSHNVQVSSSAGVLLHVTLLLLLAPGCTSFTCVNWNEPPRRGHASPSKNAVVATERRLTEHDYTSEGKQDNHSFPAKWQCDNIDDNTCHITKSQNFPGPVSLNFSNGDVVFDHGVNVVAQSGLQINITGQIKLRGNQITAERDLSFSSRGIWCEDENILSTDLMLRLLNYNEPHEGAASCGGMNFNCTMRFEAGLAAVFWNPGCFVHFGEKVGVTTKDGQYGVLIEAQVVRVEPSTSINTACLQVKASGDVEMNATCVAGPVDSDDKDFDDNILPDLYLSTPGSMVIGSSTTRWTLRGLHAAADNVIVQGTSIRTSSPTFDACGNKDSDPQNMTCDVVLKTFSSDADGAERAALGTTRADYNVSFDVAVVGKSSVIFGGVDFEVASFLGCSSNSLALQGSKIDTVGRGCGPAKGLHPGSTREKMAKCGAGGGAHVGAGGSGGLFSTSESSVTVCTPTAAAYDDFNTSMLASWLPTRAASGGGCGVRDFTTCNQMGGHGAPLRPSAGGGLVELVAMQINLTSGVQLLSDGTDGKTVTADHPTMTMVSGGGAGGQIVVRTSKLVVTDDSRHSFSAKGGQGFCTTDKVSGGGGGGFIAIRWQNKLKKAPNDLSDKIDVVVDGGQIADACDYEVPSGNRDLVQGGKGKAVSMQGCDAGRHGIFCDPCSVGSYSEHGMQCYQCANKPEEAVYTDKGWPNKTCPYKCNPFVPCVHMNHLCLSTSQYIYEAFGQNVGLVLISIATVLSYCALLTRQRLRSKLRDHHRTLGMTHMGGVSSFSSPISPISASFRRCCASFRSRVRRCLASQRSLNEFLEGFVERLASAPAHHGDQAPGGLQKFTMEQLPYHFSRVFLEGQNRWRCPWQLDPCLPKPLEGIVQNGTWEAFAQEVNHVSAAESGETLAEAVLRWVCPPLRPYAALVYRKRRLEKMQALTRCFSRSDVMWESTDLEANSSALRVSSTGDLVAIFGSDDGATLGYIDFFDFRRNQLDWAPIDVRHEAIVVVAHGHGTYSEPYELNMQDPIIQHLVHMDFGAGAVGRVIAAFNSVARFVRSIDLAMECQHGRNSRVLQGLQERVNQAAADDYMTGFVEVMAMPPCNVTAASSRGGAALRQRCRASSVTGGRSRAGTGSSFNIRASGISSGSRESFANTEPGGERSRSPGRSLCMHFDGEEGRLQLGPMKATRSISGGSIGDAMPRRHSAGARWGPCTTIQAGGSFSSSSGEMRSARGLRERADSAGDAVGKRHSSPGPRGDDLGTAKDRRHSSPGPRAGESRGSAIISDIDVGQLNAAAGPAESSRPHRSIEYTSFGGHSMGGGGVRSRQTSPHLQSYVSLSEQPWAMSPAQSPRASRTSSLIAPSSSGYTMDHFGIPAPNPNRGRRTASRAGSPRAEMRSPPMPAVTNPLSMPVRSADSAPEPITRGIKLALAFTNFRALTAQQREGMLPKPHHQYSGAPVSAGASMSNSSSPQVPGSMKSSTWLASMRSHSSSSTPDHPANWQGPSSSAGSSVRGSEPRSGPPSRMQSMQSLSAPRSPQIPRQLLLEPEPEPTQQLAQQQNKSHAVTQRYSPSRIVPKPQREANRASGSATRSRNHRERETVRSAVEKPRMHALTSPVTQSQLLEVLQQSRICPRESGSCPPRQVGSASTSSSRAAWPQGVHRPESAREKLLPWQRLSDVKEVWLPWLRSLIWRERPQLLVPQPLTLLGVLVLLVLEVLGMIFVWILCWRATAIVAISIWMLLPPLVWPMCAIQCITFLITEDPRHGRSSALFTLTSMLPPFLGASWLIIVDAADSVVFWLGFLFWTAFLKISLFCMLHVHVAHVEALHDQSLIAKEERHQETRRNSQATGDTYINASSRPSLDMGSRSSIGNIGMDWKSTHQTGAPGRSGFSTVESLCIGSERQQASSRGQSSSTSFSPVLGA
eukprot:TRINITY_DN10884_c0_g2_i1.p1 TRINITY_DN10884_c0_g2~~TRINITY_DN10884_c0_g2_i1.p1  ORF type:complete len:1918 (-),score=298.47 TRINITY_DN10884_c0_g2_i1:83-5836(-)